MKITNDPAVSYVRPPLKSRFFAGLTFAILIAWGTVIVAPIVVEMITGNALAHHGLIVISSMVIFPVAIAVSFDRTMAHA